MARTGLAIDGLKEARAAFRALSPVAQRRFGHATDLTTFQILNGAKRRVAPHRRYGFLERYLARNYNEKTGEGRVGLPRIAAVIPAGSSIAAGHTATIRRRGAATFHVYGSGGARGARVVYPSKYAHLVEFGHHRGAGKSSAPAYPFMIPAAEAERNYYLRLCREAGGHIERDLSSNRYL